MAIMKPQNKKEKTGRKEGKKNRRNEEREGGNKGEKDLWFILCKCLEVSITQTTEQNPQSVLCYAIT